MTEPNRTEGPDKSEEGQGQAGERGVPPHTQPAEEWGQRQGQGEEIASGGKRPPGPSTSPGER